MKLLLRISFLFILLTLAACTQPTPTTSPLPVPDVPPIEEVDSAISQWKNGQNTRYVVTVEETNSTGTFRYRVVIADGHVRAAQQQTKTENDWQAPTALDLAVSENYTVDALLDRVRDDVLGLGTVPMNVRVIFDSQLGFPSFVEAKALPTYNEAGNIQLNRDLGYSFTSDVKVLIEDTIGTGRDPILYITRSGGEQAWCDTLRIFPNGSSVYTDDCREILLQLTPPADQLDRLLELGTSIGSVNETKDEDGAFFHLAFNGTGTETIDANMLDQLWLLGQEMADLLSHPIGAGITLLYARENQLFGFDMRSGMGQPATVQSAPPLYGMVADPGGSLLAYSDNESLQWVDLLTGNKGVFFANPSGGHYLPRGWNGQGQLLLQRNQGNSALEWGWTSREDPSWHEINLESGAFACDTGISLNPNGSEFIVAVGGECDKDQGLTLVNMMDGEIRRLVDAQSVPGSGAFHPAWSPNGNWIAFSLTLMDTPDNPQRLFLVRADGTEMTSLTNNTTGQAIYPVWSTDSSQIFYALHGADSGEDGIYAYHLSGETELILAEPASHPVSVSPSDEFLVLYTDMQLRAYLPTHGNLFPIARGTESETLFFVGWLDLRTDK